MNPASSTKEQKVFLDALSLWDRPDEDLYGTPLADDTDTDGFIDRVLGMPSAGVLRD